MTIVNDDGHAVAECEHAPFGGIISATGEPPKNSHFCHGSYIHDRETDLYYLQSRYYNAKVGRFLNADAFASTGQGILGNNMFAYCLSNPVNYADPQGNIAVNPLNIPLVITVIREVLAALRSINYGAASPYTPSGSTEYNCYAYALGETQWKYVGGTPDTVKDFDVDNVANMVLNDAEKDGRSIRIIDSYDSPIGSNEYRIALRTGQEDYHFMMQHSDGSWSHKPGFCKTRLIDGDNPSVVSWDMPKIDPIYFYYYGIILEDGAIWNYYDSKTVYFAVSK